MKRRHRYAHRFGLYLPLFALLGLGLMLVLLGSDAPLALGAQWQLSRVNQIRLCVVLLLAVAAGQWINLLWWRARARPPRFAWQIVVLLIAAYLAVSSSPRPIALEREVALTDSVGPLGPIMANDRVFLTPIWDWSAPKGAPLVKPDRGVQTLFLFGVSPESDKANVGRMSCPDFIQQRGYLLSRERHIVLDRADLPPGAHVDYDALASFCWPGVRLSPDVDAGISAQARTYLARVAGPRDTAFTPFEIAAAEGQQTLSREISRQPSARGRYLLFLALGNDAAKELPLGEALFGSEDYFYAAHQCDVAYANFLGQQGVLYPQDAAVYLARELANTFETDARLSRPPAFVLGLPAAVSRQTCQTTLGVLAALAGGASQLPPEVAKLL